MLEKQKKEKKPKYYRLTRDGARFHHTDATRLGDGKIYVQGKSRGRHRPRSLEEVYLSAEAREAIQTSMQANRSEAMVTIIADEWEALGITFHLGLNEIVERVDYQPHDGCFALTVALTSIDPETDQSVEWILRMVVSAQLPQRVDVFDQRSLVGA